LKTAHTANVHLAHLRIAADSSVATAETKSAVPPAMMIKEVVIVLVALWAYPPQFVTSPTMTILLVRMPKMVTREPALYLA
jgi:hypothetical protein